MPSARPQRVRAEAYPLGYVEGLNDARTMLADFFRILLCSRLWGVRVRRSHRGEPFS